MQGANNAHPARGPEGVWISLSDGVLCPSVVFLLGRGTDEAADVSVQADVVEVYRADCGSDFRITARFCRTVRDDVRTGCVGGRRASGMM